MNDNGNLDVEIIYYATAMDYLRENDTSLNECMRIASEMGYTTENLNSELLASLLASENNREEFAELETEITDFFKELEEDIDNYKEEIIEKLTEKGEELEDLELLDLDELTEKAEEILN